MARIEKTVFISYRRKDISWALAVYQYLTSQKYDVFFDFSSIPSGDFEQIIVSNIKARAHFVLILTPIALDRCSEPGDWLRREIEIAIDEKRNIIPLFFDGFSFGSPSVAEKLTGKLAMIKRYNGLDIPSGYFMEAMERLRNRYLNVPLDAVIHPVSTEVRKVVKEEQVAADRALVQKQEDIQELVKPAEKKEKSAPAMDWKNLTSKLNISTGSMRRPRWIGGIVGGLLLVSLAIWGIANIGNSPPPAVPEPTQTSSPTPTRASPPARTNTPPPAKTSTPTITPVPPTPTLGVGSALVSDKDGMTLLYVPAGEFTMGSDDGDSDEKPLHTVNLDAFWIDQTEVTNKMYSLCVAAGACKEPSQKNSIARSSYYGNAEFDNYPVLYVDWNMAKTYCEWADRRLPTEAESEKAARGENAFTFPWGDHAPNNNLLNYSRAVGDTTEVGNYPAGASSYGALDMAGNVWEWVNDWYDSNYY